MRFDILAAAIWAASSLRGVRALNPTDTIMDGDSEQSGYMPNHNIDPAVLTGGQFGQLWKFQAQTPSGAFSDQYYAKPLVYTPTRLGRQVVMVFSEANRIYVLDAINGTLIASRDLSNEGEPPFKVSDLPSCNDIGQRVGITGTPVIDPNTDTVYFWAKSYLTPTGSGYTAGAYRFHAVDVVTLKEKSGFPTNIQGVPADNDNTRWFTGGTHLQRTGLNLINGVVYAGFGGHCDLFNYTGWVVGMDATSGKFLTGYSTSAGPGSPAEDGTWTGGGGGAGVWQAGAAISSDSSGRLFFATGNAKGTAPNQKVAASGSTYLSMLSECMVNLGIGSGGKLIQNDYFEPAAYAGMDAGDRDLGSGGVCLPDPAVFSGGGVNKLAITCGKNSLCYVSNRDNLGGYKNGVGGGDAVIQTITPPSGGAVFGNVGTYPLEGGYIYISPVGSPTYVYSLGFDNSGVPAFTLVGQTDDSSAGAVGVGPATITTLNNKAGTAILWISDTNGLRAYNAVPVNGKITKITLPAANGPTKFQRPSFGNGRYYMTTFGGAVLGFGAPVALPLNCSSPLEFGSVPIGTAKTILMNCTALIGLSQITGLTIGNSSYQAQNSSLPKGSLKAGDTFSFPVTFNLTSYILDAGSTSAPAVQPGVQTAALTLLTSNAVSGYASSQGITLTGTAISGTSFLTVSPLQVMFPPLTVNGSGSAAGSASTFLLQNSGTTTLTIVGYAFNAPDDDDDDGDSGSDDADEDPNAGPFTNVTLTNGKYVLDTNGYFTSPDLPAVGTKIAAGGSITVHVTFNTTVDGSYFTVLHCFTNDGQAYTILSGTAASSPIALLEQSTNEGGWTTIPDCATAGGDGCPVQIDFGTVSGQASLMKTIRFTNKGGANLVITKSKPPEGTVLGASHPSTDLSEGMSIPSGSTSNATIYFQPPSAPINSDSVAYSGAWTLNTNDLTFGIHVLNFTGTLSPKTVGPLLSNGSAQFKYLGCYQDNMNSRVEATQVNNVNNDNGLCQQQALSAGQPFAGTEYQTECHYGSAIPSLSLLVDDSKCTTYTCPGDANQNCGGYGGYITMWYDSTKYNPSTKSFIGGYTAPSTPAVIGSYKYLGCYSDDMGKRTLSSGNMGNAKTNSLDFCATACKGYSFFGTEYAAECYCGNTLQNAPVLEPDTDCNMVCSGNSSEFCGAGSRLSLYGLTNAAAASSSVSSGTIKPSASYSSAKTAMSSTSSLTSLSPRTSSTSILASTSSSRTSSTSISTLTSSTIVTSPIVSSTMKSSSMTSIAMSSASLTSATFSTLSTSTAKASSTLKSSLTAATPTPTTLWSYVGCANDTQAHRALNATSATFDTMSVEACQSFCISNNYPLAGVEYGSQCWCGLGLDYGSRTGMVGCNMACSGNSSETCGGSNFLNVYNYTSYEYPKAVQTVGSYKLLGCYTDTLSERALPAYKTASTTNMTVENCVSACSGKGYSKAGVEYAQECYCDNALASSSNLTSIYDCQANFCTGNLHEFCGGSKRLLVYSA